MFDRMYSSIYLEFPQSGTLKGELGSSQKHWRDHLETILTSNFNFSVAKIWSPQMEVNAFIWVKVLWCLEVKVET